MKNIMEWLLAQDKKGNSILGSSNCFTISHQTAQGVNERYDFRLTEEEAMQKAHGNMILAGLGVFFSIIAFVKKNPVLGFVLLLIGLVFAGMCISDWQKGKKKVPQIKCA